MLYVFDETKVCILEEEKNTPKMMHDAKCCKFQTSKYESILKAIKLNFD